MEKATDIQRKILQLMCDSQTVGYDSEDKKVWVNDDEVRLFTYDSLEKKLGIAKTELKREMIELRNNQLVELTMAVDYDYIPNGSGWLITQKGVDFAISIGIEPVY